MLLLQKEKMRPCLFKKVIKALELHRVLYLKSIGSLIATPCPNLLLGYSL